MLKKIVLKKYTEYQQLDAGKLMAVYSESNYENTDYFFPDETDKKAAVEKVEAGFLDFLKNDFFHKTEAAYWVLEADDIYVSALRTCKIREGLYYLEALETRPDSRRQGYGAMLLSGAADSLKENGPFRLCSCVSKKNTASLKTHEKCGFRVVLEEGYDYLNGEADDHDFGLEYTYRDDSVQLSRQ
ncbi:MAG: GNAT family N-acetyltransferase [Lachnospiraceae bacterium]|nr:GNAT family N-acetyltransferase [Lachnospiraceae bacterium]